MTNRDNYCNCDDIHEIGLEGCFDVLFEEIAGDPNSNPKLKAELNKKENTDVQKIKEFFEANPEFDYRFLITIANKPVEEVVGYVELIRREFELHKPVALIPYDVGLMCIVLKFNEPTNGETFRCFIPKAGLILSVSMIDASGLVKFSYKYVGDDEGQAARWGNITGNIKDQTDLGENYVDSESNITSSQINALFG